MTQKWPLFATPVNETDTTRRLSNERRFSGNEAKGGT
jgi:hypothetical protein